MPDRERESMHNTDSIVSQAHDQDPSAKNDFVNGLNVIVNCRNYLPALSNKTIDGQFYDTSCTCDK